MDRNKFDKDIAELRIISMEARRHAIDARREAMHAREESMKAVNEAKLMKSIFGDWIKQERTQRLSKNKKSPPDKITEIKTQKISTKRRVARKKTVARLEKTASTAKKRGVLSKILLGGKD